jgi:hypothetical protein
MPVTGMYYKPVYGHTDDTGYSQSVRIGFSPSYAAALTTLSNATGGGLVEIGISQYTYRPAGQAFDTTVNYGPFQVFGGNVSVPAVYDPHMTSATAEVWVGGGNQTGAGLLTIWFFG